MNNFSIEIANQIAQAAKIIHEGGIVAFPTETVYGLGADAFNETAVAKIYAAKNRPAMNPLIVHIANLDQVGLLAQNISPTARKLIAKFWPGPLTILLQKSSQVPHIVTAGHDTVAIRMPDHQIAVELIRQAGTPIAAPSANPSGKPSATHHQHVLDNMKDKVDYVITGGNVDIGVESTIVDLSEDKPTLLRAGGLPIELIEQVIGPLHRLSQQGDETKIVKAPGMLFKHYAPNAEMILVDYEPEMIKNMQQLAHKFSAQKVGILTTDQHRNEFPADYNVLSLGDENDLTQVSNKLFDQLHQFDKLGVDVIISQSFPTAGLGLAIMDRLRRAAQK